MNNQILPQNILTTTKIVEGMGYSSAISLAKSIFINGNARVLLVLDSDTTDENEIKEKENYIKNTFNLISSDSDYKVLYLVPEIETLFFVDKSFIENIFTIQMNDREFELSKSNPKSSIKKLAKNMDYYKVVDNCLNNLPNDVIQKIQHAPVINEMIKYATNRVESERV